MNKRLLVTLTAFLIISAHGAGIPEFTNVWTAKIGAANNSSPALSPDGILYFGSGDHHLYAVSTNRYVVWAFETGLDIKSSPAIADDGTIYVGSRDRKLYAVTPAGKLKWSFATDGWVDSSPAIALDGTVYFGSWDRKFYALTAAGAKKWVFTTGGEIVSSPAVATDGTIFFGSHDKKLYALKSDGTKKWEFATGGPIVSSPAIDFSGNIYFSSVDGKFYALKPDGTLLWSVQTGGITESSPVLGVDGTIYIGINKFRAAISADGKVKWQDLSQPWLLLDSTPTVGANNQIFYTAGDGTLTALANTDGRIQREGWLKDAGFGAPLIAPDGLVYVAGWGGLFNAEVGNTTLAKSAWPMFRANLRHTGVVNAPPR